MSMTDRPGDQDRHLTDQVAIREFRTLFENALQEIYWAEKAFMRILPKMIRRSCADELKTALKEHMQVTWLHAYRLEEIFTQTTILPHARKCEGMEGLVRSAEKYMRSGTKGPAQDALLIAATQKILHFEMAAYSVLISLSRITGDHGASRSFERTLEEGNAACKQLREIADIQFDPKLFRGNRSVLALYPV
jgi:ferritin-like metal-binding protein YciE